MVQKLIETQERLINTEQWREELARNQRYDEAACQYEKEKLVGREMARLRLKLQLGGKMQKNNWTDVSN